MNKKIIFISIILLLFLGIFIFFIINKNNSSNELEKITEYTPEEEINLEQLRETILTLYFLDTETQNLKSEGRLIDSNMLLNNPYKFIIQCLLDGPTSDSLENVFPENTRIIDTSFNNNCVTLNFSEEILNFKDDNQKFNIINSILNSLTQLTEVNSIKFLINGNIDNKLNEEYSAIY